MHGYHEQSPPQSKHPSNNGPNLLAWLFSRTQQMLKIGFRYYSDEIKCYTLQTASYKTGRHGKAVDAVTSPLLR
jgi:hypothetical protein